MMTCPDMEVKKGIGSFNLNTISLILNIILGGISLWQFAQERERQKQEDEQIHKELEKDEKKHQK